MGHDEDAANRICDAIAEDAPNVMKKQQEQGLDQDDGNKGASLMDAQSSKMLDQCVKMKMKADDSLSEDDAKDECQDAFDKKSAWLDPNTGESVRPGDTGDADDQEDDDNGDDDGDMDIQQDYTAGTGFDLGNEGPSFDPNLEVSSMDGNDHIDTHMSGDQKDEYNNLDDLSVSMTVPPFPQGNPEEQGFQLSDVEEKAEDYPDVEQEEQDIAKQQEQGQNLKYEVVPPGFQGPIIGGKSIAPANQLLRQAQVEPFESNGRFFVKAFLMDTSVNQNNWGVSPKTLDANMSSYIGKPLVLTENFDHPDSGDPDLSHALLYQELYRIGNIVDVVKDGSRYDAICEITDPYSIDAWRQGELPLYVSPQLYKRNAAEPDSGITDWEGTHLALVTNPAYGVKIATHRATCSGEQDKCLAYLKKASIIEKHGYGSCGYCNRKLLLSAASSAAIQHSNSVAVKEPKVNLPPAATSSLKTTSSHSDDFGVTTVNNLPEPQVEKPPTATAAVTAATPKEAEYKKQIADLEQKLAIAIKSGELKSNVNADLAKRMAALEAEHRKDKVAAILSAANITEGFDERVSSLAKSNLPLEEITSIYSAYTALKSASAAQSPATPEKKVTYVEPKVSMRSGSTTESPPAAETKPARPSWLSTHNYLMKGVTT